METTIMGYRGIRVCLEVHCTYNLLSNCNYNPIISRVTVVMGLILRLELQLRSR